MPIDSKKDIRYEIIEVPICTGSPTEGSQHAYSTLKPHLASLFGDRASFTDCTADLTASGIYPDNLKHLDVVMKASSYLCDTALAALKNSRIPVIIGGDHSIAMGSIAAVSAAPEAESTAVVYIDAHADINTEISSETGYIHGMPLAASLGLCCNELDIGTEKRKVFGENIHIIGARSIDDGEYPIIRDNRVDLVTADECRSLGVEAVIRDLLPKLKGKSVHISFDVDCLDPEEFSSTGYIIPKGLSLDFVEKLISAVVTGSEVVSFECVEYNPTLDKNGCDLAKLLDVFSVFNDSINRKTTD